MSIVENTRLTGMSTLGKTRHTMTDDDAYDLYRDITRGGINIKFPAYQAPRRPLAEGNREFAHWTNADSDGVPVYVDSEVG